MPAQWDAIVVGAGPAGVSAALAIQRAGGKPLLIDCKTFPRPKACAGMLSESALRETPVDLTPAISSVSDGLIWQWHQQRQWQLERNMMSHRLTLDHYLFAQAMSAGIMFRHVPRLATVKLLPDQVRLTTSQRELLSARYLIAADGANSSIRRLLGLPAVNRHAFAVEIDVEHHLPDNTNWAFFDFDAVAGGYGWVFPKGGRTNIGIAVMQGMASDISATLTAFLKEVAPNAPLQGKARGAAIGSYGPSTLLGMGNVLFTGDAAGLTDPLTGEGLSHAFRSGKAAGNAIMRGGRNNADTLTMYTAALAPYLKHLEHRRTTANLQTYSI